MNYQRDIIHAFHKETCLSYTDNGLLFPAIPVVNRETEVVLKAYINMASIWCIKGNCPPDPSTNDVILHLLYTMGCNGIMFQIKYNIMGY